MDLPLSRALAPSLLWLESCGSTNIELVQRAAELPDGAVVATDTQTQGRGRLGRVWAARPGSSLAVSVLLRHDAAPGGDPGPDRISWLPLLAGVAMTRAVRALGVADAQLKWPNDVLVEAPAGEGSTAGGSAADASAAGASPARHYGKLSGNLSELTPHGAVVGVGLNLTATVDELPVPTATSLVLQGVSPQDATVDRALAAFLSAFWPIVELWRAEPQPARLRALVEPELATLQRVVRVDRAGLPLLVGTASGLDDDGRLVVRPADAPDEAVAVAAGDVTHLRYE